MAISKFLVVLALFFTCLSLAISDPNRGKTWEETEIVNTNEETDVKEPEQWGGPYKSWCRNGCCYKGNNGCIRCCRYPNKETNSVETQKKRGRGGCKYGCCGSYAYGQCSACCSLSQAAKKAKEEDATPVGAHVQP